MRVITVHSAKGGVGKTTTALSIASILADLGSKVLLLDLDPQAAATKHLVPETQYDWDKTVRQVLLGEVEFDQTLLHPWPNVTFCPSQLRLQNIEKELADATNPIFILHDLLDRVRDEYDFCIFDTQPNTGLLTRAAVVASHHVIIPVLLEAWPVESLELSFDMLGKVTDAQKYLTTKMSSIHIVPTFFEDRRQLTEAFHYALRQGYADHLTQTVIHRSVDVAKTYGTALSRLNASMRAKTEYTQVIDEVLGGKDGQ